VTLLQRAEDAFAQHRALVRDIIAAAVIMVLLGVAAFSEGAVRFVFLGAGLGIGAVVPFGGLLALAVTVWTLPLMQMPAVVSDIRADELLLAAVAIGAVVRVVVRRDWKPSAVERAFAIFVGATVISLGLKYALGYEMPLRAVALPVLRHASRLVLLVVAMYLLKGRSARFPALAWAMTAGALFAAALGIAQYHLVPVHDWIVATFPTLDGGFNYPYVPGGIGYRSMATFDGNPNRFGVAMAIMALLATVRAVHSTTRGRAVTWGALALVFLVAILFTTSRSAFLVALGLLLVAAVLLKSKAPLAVLGSWAVITALIPNLMVGRVMDLFGTKTATGIVPDPSVSGRVEAITEGAAGAGHMLPTYDNFFVDLYRNFGVVALVGLLWLLWVVSSRLWRAMRSGEDGNGYAAAALLAWAVLLLVSFTGAFFITARVSEIVWILVALGLARPGPDDGSARQLQT
jgi:hypothetical protein